MQLFNVIEFFPSTTAASEPVAVSVESFAVIFPVEYIAGESVPVVLTVPSVKWTVPSPLSVASPAQWVPALKIKFISSK